MFDDDSKFNEGRKLAFRNLPLAAIEVHCDRKTRFTGNVFIEYSCRDEPSGISISTAKYWGLELADDTWVVIPTARLKQLVEHHKANGASVRGGDGGVSMGVLIPLGQLFAEQRKAAAKEEGRQQNNLFDKQA